MVDDAPSPAAEEEIADTGAPEPELEVNPEQTDIVEGEDPAPEEEPA